MATKMTHRERADLANRVRRRYRSATTKQKSKILDEFIAVTGYHPKSAIRILNAEAREPRRQIRVRPALYDEAAQAALIVLWEASDRLCSKRLKALLPILVPALERHGHLKLDALVRTKIFAMSDSTIDRLLRAPRCASRPKQRRRAEPAVRRRVPIRTFTDWHEPAPGHMEMDLVAHCGDVNRGSYVHTLALTDIATGWTECAALVVRESGVLVESLERVRVGLPFRLRALDVDNGSEFVNETLLQYCLRHGIEFTRSRPYRKNDQAWIEQKNGAIVRKLLGYRRFEGIAAAQALSRLYGASRLFVNFFQPSFKLAEKHRDGAQVSKRYHPPLTPCDRLLQTFGVSDVVKAKLREVGEALDPLQLLEEIRAVQAHLIAVADGEKPAEVTAQPPNLTAFLSSLASAWRGGDVRPTFSVEAKPRYLRGLQQVAASKPAARAPAVLATELPTPPPEIAPRPKPVYAKPFRAAPNAFDLVWPMVCRRLEGRPSMNAAELFDELCLQYAGRYHRNQRGAFTRRVKVWRADARARGVEIGKLTHRKSEKPRGRTRPDPLQAHWPEMLEYLEKNPDHTALELMIEFVARYPERYRLNHLRTLQRRVKIWRRQKVQQLIGEMHDYTKAVGVESQSNPELLPPSASDRTSLKMQICKTEAARG